MWWATLSVTVSQGLGSNGLCWPWMRQNTEYKKLNPKMISKLRIERLELMATKNKDECKKTTFWLYSKETVMKWALKSFFSHGCFKGNSQNLGMKAEKSSPIIKKNGQIVHPVFIFYVWCYDETTNSYIVWCKVLNLFCQILHFWIQNLGWIITWYLIIECDETKHFTVLVFDILGVGLRANVCIF